MATKGNVEALKTHKAESQADTRMALENALARLRNGHPTKVSQGSKINAANLAKEAGVDRSTIYRYHPTILNELQRVTNSTVATRLKTKHDEYIQAETKAKEYRLMLEAAQTDKEALKRENYRLQHRINELENCLKQRDVIIVELQRKVSPDPKVVVLK